MSILERLINHVRLSQVSHELCPAPLESSRNLEPRGLVVRNFPTSLLSWSRYWGTWGHTLTSRFVLPLWYLWGPATSGRWQKNVMTYVPSYAPGSTGEFVTCDPRTWRIDAGKISNSKIVHREISSPTTPTWGEGTGFRNKGIIDMNRDCILF